MPRLKVTSVGNLKELLSDFIDDDCADNCTLQAGPTNYGFVIRLKECIGYDKCMWNKIVERISLQ